MLIATREDIKKARQRRCQPGGRKRAVVSIPHDGEDRVSVFCKNAEAMLRRLKA